MNRFQGTVAGVLIAGMLAGGVASAQGPRRGGPGGPAGGRMGAPGMPLRQLNLTDAQEEQIRSIRERERADAQQVQEALRKAVDAQRKAIETVPVNEGLVRQATQALADAQTEVALHQARVFNEVWSVLTPAQQADAKKLQAERDARQSARQQDRQDRRQQR